MILLDTCALLWLGSDQSRLSGRATELIGENQAGLFVSSISAFEIALKHRRKKLVLPQEPQAWFQLAVEHLGLHEIAADAGILVLSVALPELHRDPCDRIIAATAKAHRLICLTPDPLIRQYPGVETAW